MKWWSDLIHYRSYNISLWNVFHDGCTGIFHLVMDEGHYATNLSTQLPYNVCELVNAINITALCGSARIVLHEPTHRSIKPGPQPNSVSVQPLLLDYY